MKKIWAATGSINLMVFLQSLDVAFGGGENEISSYQREAEMEIEEQC
tara:strand:+ start:1341 stop:1481 length:141 start_codon:yes stop_codon:yes gene_type:complete